MLSVEIKTLIKSEINKALKNVRHTALEMKESCKEFPGPVCGDPFLNAFELTLDNAICQLEDTDNV